MPHTIRLDLAGRVADLALAHPALAIGAAVVAALIFATTGARAITPRRPWRV